jgi:hypothetical protein
LAISRERTAILKPISDYAQRQSLRSRAGLCFGLAIAQHARERWHLGNPAFIFLALSFDFQHSIHPNLKRFASLTVMGNRP